MFKPVRMTRVLLGGHRDHMEDAIALLHAKASVHIEDFRDADAVTQAGDPLESGDRLSSQLVRVRGLIQALGADVDHAKSMATDDADRIIKDAEAVVLPAVDRLTDLRQQVQALDAEADALEPFQAMSIDLGVATSLSSLTAYIGHVNTDPRGDLGNISFECEMDDNAIALFVPAADAKETEAILARHSFTAAALPTIKGTAADRLATIRREAAETLQSVSKAEQEVAALREQWGERLAALEASLSQEVAKTQAPLQFGVTETTFHVEGWVPRRDMNTLRDGLKDRFKGRVYLEELGDGPATAGHHDDHHHVSAADEAPVHTQHGGPAKPFTFILNLLSRPRYNEVDPTLLLALFFPLMFGLMVGDLAVGILIMLFGLFIKKKPLMGIGGPSVGNALVIGGLFAAVIGGVVFGEALGIHFVVNQHGIDEGEMSWHCILGMDIPLENEGAFFHLTTDTPIDCAGAHHADGGTGDAHAAVDPGHGAASADSHGDGIVTHAETSEKQGSILAPHSHTHLSAGGFVNLGYYSKIHDIQALLVWSIMIALVHLTLGFLIGTRNVAKGHGVTLAIQEKVAWLTLMLGFGVLVYGLTGGPSWGTPTGAGIIVASIALLWMGAAKVIGAGFIAVLEVFGFLGNILSYTRLAAVGASKAGMALAFAAIGFDVVGGAAGWVIYLFGMVVITLLAILTGGLHALRLQFVEFFGKFYEGGGRAYEPFGRN